MSEDCMPEVNNPENDTGLPKKQRVSKLLSFTDKGEQCLYEEFLQHQTPMYILHVVVLVSFLFVTTDAVISYEVMEDQPLKFLLALIRLSPMIALTMYWYKMHEVAFALPVLPIRAVNIGNFVIVVGVLTANLELLNDFSPTNDGEINSFTMRYYTKFIGDLITCSLTAKCHHFWSVLVAFSIQCMGSILLFRTMNTDAMSVAFVSVVIVFAMYHHETQTITLFRSLLDNEKSVRAKMKLENEKEVSEMRTVEMRHLIANIAHDLKTPLHVFTLELENLAGHDILGINKSSIDATASHSIEHLRSVCSFMLMTINRSLDFTKVTSGNR
jgi:signal transduction histidine kinase